MTTKRQGGCVGIELKDAELAAVLEEVGSCVHAKCSREFQVVQDRILQLTAPLKEQSNKAAASRTRLLKKIRGQILADPAWARFMAKFQAECRARIVSAIMANLQQKVEAGVPAFVQAIVLSRYREWWP